MTTATAPRTPKKKDYARVALEAAQASIAKQTAAHVEVLKAADQVTETEAAVVEAQREQAAATAAYNTAVYGLVEMLGLAEASERLGLDIKVVRAASKAGADQTNPAGEAASPRSPANPADNN